MLPSSYADGTNSFRKPAVLDTLPFVWKECALCEHHVSCACMGYFKSICVCNLPPWVLLQHMPLPRGTVALTAAYLLSRTMCRGENSILGQLKAEGKSCVPLWCAHRLLLLDRGIRSL